MNCEVVAVGTELLLGQIVDTNSSWIGEQLAVAGIDSYFQTKVGDNLERIVAALEQALDRSDAVIVCGGLGPTPDDITRDAIAAVMGTRLVRDETAASRIRARFGSRNRVMPANNLRQADVPQGARVMDVQPGTAPGLICGVRRCGADKVIYAVPGVPWEMQRMVSECVLGDLQARSGERGVIASRTLLTWGQSESGLAEMLDPEIRRLDASGEATVAFLASGWNGLKVRITAKAPDAETVQEVLSTQERRMRSVIDELIFGVDDDTMESVTLGLLLDQGLTLGLAESVTGGLIASRLTGVPGASAVLRGAIVPYHRDLKTSLLGTPANATPSNQSNAADGSGMIRVRDAQSVGRASNRSGIAGGSRGATRADTDAGDVWAARGRGADAGASAGSASGGGVSVVSEEMALAMAEGACRALGSDVGLATTGVAGPSPHGGAEPGTVWIGLWLDGSGHAQRLLFPFDRKRVREFSTITALNLLRKRLLARIPI